jgi:hypothetical protein
MKQLYNFLLQTACLKAIASQVNKQRNDAGKAALDFNRGDKDRYSLEQFITWLLFKGCVLVHKVSCHVSGQGPE